MARFGSFTFAFGEEPIWPTHPLWRRRPTYSRKRPLGSGVDVVRTMALGSYETGFEVMLTPDRFNTLLAFLNTVATFIDWDSPVGNSRSALMTVCEPVEMIDNTVVTADMVNRYRLEFVSQ